MSVRLVKLKADAIEWRRLEDEIVALDLRSSRYLAVNRTGAAIWNLMIEGAPVERLAAEVSDQFSVSMNTALKDVRAFVAELSTQDLLDCSQAR